jgi:multimeric flavodoxin WrbA
MKIIALNGSPRKNWNTHTMLKKALEGAESAGLETELINLYDIDYKGCTSCFVCQNLDGKSKGHCAYNDGLKPVLEKIDNCDGIILGSPIYFGDITAGMRALLERLLFQHLSYDKKHSTTKANKRAGFIYTMNASEGYCEYLYKKYQEMLSWNFDYIGTAAAAETLQTDDYAKYNITFFDETERKTRRKEVFPKDCQAAFELGKKMAKQ